MAQRIWLGTFKSDIEARLAYDRACMKLRPTGDDNYLNFQKEHELGLNLTRGVHGFGGVSFKFLFQKELTSSDVGKLNRLLIPKKFAVKHFPPISENHKHDDEVHLSFYDMRTLKLWKFRYCFYQSYVFSKGWNQFVEENGLKANDTITFFVCHNNIGNTFWVIDVGPGVSRVDEEQVDVKVDLSSRLGQNLDSTPVQEIKARADNRRFCFQLEPTDDRKKRVKLFGAYID